MRPHRALLHLIDLHLDKWLRRIDQLAQQFPVVVDDPVDPPANLAEPAHPDALDDAAAVVADHYVIAVPDRFLVAVADHVLDPAGEHPGDMVGLRRQ